MIITENFQTDSSKNIYSMNEPQVNCKCAHKCIQMDDEK